MRYMLLIAASEEEENQMDEKSMGELIEQYGRFSEEMAGVTQASDRLQPTSTATSVRIRNGEVTITDGPFAETKEQIGGFYLIDVANLDEAIAWAKKVPSADYGTIEVRPIWEME